MKRKTFSILLALVLVLSFSLVMAVPAAADTITVGPGGPPTYDYATIQEAVNAASSGDTIIVAAGTYAETITFNVGFSKDNLTIVGESDINRPVVTGGVNFQNTGAFSGLTLGNLYLKGDGGANRIVNMGNPGAVNNFIMDNCVLDGENIGGRMGIYGSGFGGSFTITNTEFKNILGWAVLDTNGAGVVTEPLTTITFANNYIHDSDGAVALRGLSTDWTDAVHAYGNTWNNINGNGGAVTDAWAALEVNRASEVHIYDSTIDGVAENSWGEGEGLQLWSIDTLDVHGNTIANCHMGVWIASVDPVVSPAYTFVGNTFYDNSLQLQDDLGALDIAAVLAQNSFDRAVTVDHPGSSLLPIIWSSIQDAIDAASPGDTIIVAAGTYAETVVVDKQLTLQGAGSASTIIDASGASADYGILLTAGGTSASQRLIIKGLTIKNSPSHGIKAYKAGGLSLDYVTLEDVVLTLNGVRGMEIHNWVTVSDMEIKSCEFVSNGAQGLRTASNVIVNGMTITDSKFNGNSYGIYLQGTINGVTILRSEFNNNIGHGGYMTETGPLSNLMIEDSQFNGNYYGLVVWNERDNTDITIRGTSFQDNDKGGIWMVGDSLTNVLVEECAVLNNDVLNSGVYGITFGADSNVMTNVAVHFTSIDGHTIGGGIENYSLAATAIVDATLNWWGDVSGPHHPGSWDYYGVEITNPDGQGDAVTDYVLYEPWMGQEGMATGGGWFIPEWDKKVGLVTPGGKATFGFVAKKKSDTSSGQLEFQYQADDLRLKSTSYDWVTVSNTQVIFEGTGRLNGVDGYKFRVWAFDGDKAGGQPDRFTIRIWTGGDSYESPTYRAEGNLGGGQIVVHKK